MALEVWEGEGGIYIAVADQLLQEKAQNSDKKTTNGTSATILVTSYKRISTPKESYPLGVRAKPYG